MAAEGLIDFDELRTKLAVLDGTRDTARRELEALEVRREQLAELERDCEALMKHYAAMVPEDLDALLPEERYRVYKMLKLKVSLHANGALEANWTFESALIYESETSSLASCPNKR